LKIGAVFENGATTVNPVCAKEKDAEQSRIAADAAQCRIVDTRLTDVSEKRQDLRKIHGLKTVLKQFGFNFIVPLFDM